MKTLVPPNKLDIAKARLHDPETTYRATCGADVGNHKQSGCGAEMEIELTDLFRVTESLGMQMAMCYKWMCPHCKQLQLVPRTIVPDNFKVPTKEAWMKKQYSVYRRELVALNPGAGDFFPEDPRDV